MINITNTRQQEYDLKGNPSQKLYAKRLVHFLQLYTKKLGVPDYYCEEAIGIYHDIINFLEKEYQDGFTRFYENLGSIKGTRFVSGALLMIILNKNELSFTQKNLAQHLNIINADNLSNTYNAIIAFLKQFPEYSYIYRFLSAQCLVENEYLLALEVNIKQVTKLLVSQKLIEDTEITYILGILKNYYEQIKNNYEKLSLKHPRYISYALCWIYLTFSKNYDISVTQFMDLIEFKQERKDSNNAILNEGTFDIEPRLISKLVNDFLHAIYRFDPELYKEQVIDFLGQYIEKLRVWLIRTIPVQKKLNKVLKKVETPFLSSCIHLYEKSIENGFEILFFTKTNKLSYYFPQTMALSLIYFNFKSNKGICSHLSSAKLKQVFHNDKTLTYQKRSFRYIAENSNRLYPYLKEEIGRYKGQIYSREDFINELEESLTNFYHRETDFLLSLYKMTDLDPYVFGNELQIHSGRGVMSIFDIIRNKSRFREPHTFRNIERFIDKHLSKADQTKALAWIGAIKNTRQKEFKHGSVVYSFGWNKDRTIGFLQNALHKYLSTMWRGEYPREIFMDSANPRISNLKFIGSKAETLPTKEIKEFFSQYVIKHSSKHQLCKQVQEVFTYYKNNLMGKIPDHPPILNTILRNNDHAIAIEIPVWKKVQNKDNFYTGHVDLLLIKEDTLIIGDYKPTEWKIYKSLPQITGYALLLKERLKEYVDVSNLTITCVGFSKSYIVEWSPEELYPQILKFIKKQNSKRSVPLLTASRKYKKGLLKELKKLTC